jgi:hypothetical protein
MRHPTCLKMSPSSAVVLATVAAGLLPSSVQAAEEDRAWSVAEVPCTIAAGPGVDRAEMRRVVLAAMQTWNDAGVGPLLVLDDGEDATEAAFDGVNQIFFVGDGWAYDKRELGRTLSNVESDTRRILDADIVINAEHHVFSTTTPATDVDLQSLVTHELGHLLGIRHLSDEEAAMFEKLDPQTTEKRDLSDHDVEALHTIYADIELTETNAGCSQVASSGHGPFAALAMLLVVMRRARSKR